MSTEDNAPLESTGKDVAAWSVAPARFLDTLGHPMKWNPDLAIHTHEDGSPICSVAPAEIDLGDGSKMLVPQPVKFESSAERISQEPWHYRDRGEKFPWDVAVATALGVGLLALGVWYCGGRIFGWW